MTSMSLLYILYHVYDVVVKKVHVRYLISWWVSCWPSLRQLLYFQLYAVLASWCTAVIASSEWIILTASAHALKFHHVAAAIFLRHCITPVDNKAMCHSYFCAAWNLICSVMRSGRFISFGDTVRLLRLWDGGERKARGER